MKLDDKIKELEKMRFAAQAGELRDRGFVMDLFAFDKKYGHGLARLRALAKLRDTVASCSCYDGSAEDGEIEYTEAKALQAIVAYLCVSEGFEP